MASNKITVTLPQDQVTAIQRLVNSGMSSSVSGFIQHAVGVASDDVAGWGAMLAQGLSQTGGDMTAEERAWADRILGVKDSTAGQAA